MSEFELLAQDLLEKAEAEEQLRQENDKKLLGQVLEIYDQKYVAGHCCKVSDEAAFCLIQRPYISKTLLTRRISPRGSP
uniref:hypothetical protein n=1 Tax=Enterobacter cloacae complex sp. TaxID=2027919 RepID=UPI003B63503B